eukprot:12902447-Prorocentrum_lima.AAC.1
MVEQHQATATAKDAAYGHMDDRSPPGQEEKAGMVSQSTYTRDLAAAQIDAADVLQVLEASANVDVLFAEQKQ